MQSLFFNQKVLTTVLFFFGVSCIASSYKDTLTVGYYESPPFVKTHTDGTLSGVSYWMWKEIYKDNDSLYIEYVDFTHHKSPLLEILEQLKQKKIDVSLTPLTITPARAKFVKFSQPFYVSNLTVAVPNRNVLDEGVNFFKGIFSKNFLITIVGLMVVIFIFGFLVWLFEHKADTSDFSRDSKGIINSIWWSAVTMTTVGYGDMAPKTIGGRVIALIWMFSAIILVSSFTASITTSLTLDGLGKDVSSLDSFKNKRIGTVKGSATDVFLTENFFNKKIVAPELTKGLEQLQERKIDAFIYDESFLRYHIENTPNFKRLKITNLRFNVDLYAFGFNTTVSDSTIHDFNRKVIAIRNSRAWEYLLREYHLSEI